MTETYDQALNAGVRAVLDLASHTAASIDAITVLKPTRFTFAAEALRGLAEEGHALLKRPMKAMKPTMPELARSP